MRRLDSRKIMILMRAVSLSIPALLLFGCVKGVSDESRVERKEYPTEAKYKLVENWCKPPAGKKTIGNSHGEIRLDKAGNVYVSTETEDGAIQVYAQDGTFVRSIANDYPGIHGFVIHEDEGEEFIYAAHLKGSQVLKMRLDGTVVLKIPKSSFPEDKLGKEKKRRKKKGKKNEKKKRGTRLKVTSVDVAPNGDIYAVDGYGKDFIHRFDKTGKHIASFGGRGEPYKLKNCHKIFIDPRFSPARLLLCDRVNLRLVHLDLEGNLLGEAARDLRRPSSATFFGDWVAIAEIAGRVSILDKAGKTLATLGTNETKGQINTNRVKPEQWKPGVFTAPHGIAFATPRGCAGSSR